MEIKRPKIKSMKWDDFKDNEYIDQLVAELNASGTNVVVGKLDQLINWGISNSLWPFCFGNAVLEIDNRGNKRPVKRSQSDACKIDPVQAIIMALDLYERYEGMNH